MSRRFASAAAAAPYLAVAARLALGVLWLGEARTKFAAGFGAADIGLVVQSTAGNSRVPPWYADLLAHTIGVAPALAGVAVPLTEGLLGTLLVLGILSRWTAAVSALVLSTYWLSDQLIVQYPVMLALGAVVLLFPVAASRLSVAALIRSVRTRRDTAVVHPRFTRP